MALDTNAAGGANPFGSISDAFGSINSALGSIFGSTNKQTVNSTLTTQIDEEGLKYLLNTVLSGTGGLADVSAGENVAGLYDSATNTLLVNDLLARAAGEVAARNVTTTTNQTSKQKTPGIVDQVGGVIGGVTKTANKIGKKIKKLF